MKCDICGTNQNLVDIESSSCGGVFNKCFHRSYKTLCSRCILSAKPETLEFFRAVRV